MDSQASPQVPAVTGRGMSAAGRSKGSGFRFCGLGRRGRGRRFGLEHGPDIDPVVLQLVAVVAGDLEEAVHLHRLGGCRTRIDALGAVDAAVVVDDHPEALLGLVDRGDLDGLGRAIPLAGPAGDAHLRIEIGRAAEVLGDLELLEGIIDGGRLFEEMAQELGEEDRYFHGKNPFRRMMARSWSTARGARYFQAKDMTWSTRMREVSARSRHRRKMTKSVLPTNGMKPTTAPPGKPPRQTAARRPLEATSSMSKAKRKRATFFPA